MCRKALIWFLAVAFLGFVCSPEAACGQAVTSEVDAPVVVDTEPALTGGVMGSPEIETVSVRQSLQFAQADGVHDAVKEESNRTVAEEREGTTENVKRGGGLSTGAVIAVVIISIALVALAVVAGGALGGSGGFSGLKLNVGK